MRDLDEALFRWLNNQAGRSDLADRAISFLIGDYLIPFLATLAIAWLWFAGRGKVETDRYQHAAILGLVSLGICQLVVALANIGVGRLRPFEQLSNVTVLFYEPINSSFPAHPVANVVALGIVIWIVRRPLGAVVLFLGAVLGTGRIIAGLWFPTDVLGGIAVGALSFVAGRLVLERLSRAEIYIRRKTADLGLG